MSGQRFDERVQVRVALAGGRGRLTTLAALFRAVPEFGPQARQDIRGAIAGRFTWCGGGDPDRPAFTVSPAVMHVAPRARNASRSAA